MGLLGVVKMLHRAQVRDLTFDFQNALFGILRAIPVPCLLSRIKHAFKAVLALVER